MKADHSCSFASGNGGYLEYKLDDTTKTVRMIRIRRRADTDNNQYLLTGVDVYVKPSANGAGYLCG